MNNKKLLAIAIAAVSFSSAQALAADAEQQNAAQLEEVLVTARKKVENLQQTPMAITAFTAAEIEQFNITDTRDVARYTPSLTFDVGVLPNDTRPSIRGVNTTRGRPNTAVLVDFVDVSSESLTVAGGGMTANMRLLDLERVEVVKGPSTALYGRSAFSGAINYISKRPTEEFTAEVRGDFDEHGTQDLRLMVSGPVTDTLGARLNLMSYDTDGWYDNPNTGGDLGTADNWGGALALQWQPVDNFTAYLRAEYSDEDYSPRGQVFHTSVEKPFDQMLNFFGTGTVTDYAIQAPYEFSGTTECNGVDRLQPFFDSFGFGPACRPLITGEQSADEKQIDTSADPRTDKDYDGTDVDNTRVHLELDYEMDNGISFVYLFGYTDNETTIQEDFDLTDDPLISAQGFYSQFGFQSMSQQDHELEQYSHELRISGEMDKLNWMLSGLRWEEDMDTSFADEWWLREGADKQWLIDNVFVYFGATDIATGPGNTPATPISRDTTHWSAALSLTYAITDTINLTAEGRYLDEEIDYKGRGEDRAFYSAFGFGPGQMTKNSVSDSEFVPRFSVDWSITDDAMVYATYAEGFKPGGVSTADANGDVSNGQYKPEKLDTYEIGIKSDWLNDTLRVNAAAFYNDYTDQQVPYFFTDPLSGLLNSTVINAGETEVSGFELETTWRPIEGLALNLAYTYVDAEYSDFNTREILAQTGGVPNALTLAQAGNEDGDFSNKKVMGTPENAMVAAARYDMNLMQGIDGYVELIATYEDERYLDQGNNLHVPDHTLLDAYAGISGENWTVTVYTINLTDEDDIQSGIANVDYGFLPDGQNVPAGANLILPQPRTVGARFSYKF
jgi:iron complex outermembrane receptor protein